MVQDSSNEKLNVLLYVQVFLEWNYLNVVWNADDVQNAEKLPMLD